MTTLLNMTKPMNPLPSRWAFPTIWSERIKFALSLVVGLLGVYAVLFGLPNAIPKPRLFVWIAITFVFFLVYFLSYLGNKNHYAGAYALVFLTGLVVDIWDFYPHFWWVQRLSGLILIFAVIEYNLYLFDTTVEQETFLSNPITDITDQLLTSLIEDQETDKRGKNDNNF